MSNVYFKKVSQNTSVKEVNAITKELLDRIIKEENIKLGKKIPLKVHFGEIGNETYIKAENFDGIIDYLAEKNIESCFMETSVLYGGQRKNRELHLKTAKEHNFTRLPVIIADGEQGENFAEVEINKTHFKTCKIGKDFLDYDQYIVLSHFKGHMLSGFGGAIKQLGMGYASKGGKLAMHVGMKPKLVERKCKKCHLCEPRCNENAITIGEHSFIDYDKCVGCGACFAVCPNKAVTIYSFRRILKMIGIGNPFQQKLVEYAYAAQKDKKNIYINFLMSITGGCDCESKKMKLLLKDIGIFVSTDPVAIDKACHDMAKRHGKDFKGAPTFKYANKIGFGSTQYSLIEVQ